MRWALGPRRAGGPARISSALGEPPFTAGRRPALFAHPRSSAACSPTSPMNIPVVAVCYLPLRARAPGYTVVPTRTARSSPGRAVQAERKHYDLPARSDDRRVWLLTTRCARDQARPPVSRPRPAADRQRRLERRVTWAGELGKGEAVARVLPSMTVLVQFFLRPRAAPRRQNHRGSPRPSRPRRLSCAQHRRAPWTARGNPPRLLRRREPLGSGREPRVPSLASQICRAVHAFDPERASSLLDARPPPLRRDRPRHPSVQTRRSTPPS